MCVTDKDIQHWVRIDMISSHAPIGLPIAGNFTFMNRRGRETPWGSAQGSAPQTYALLSGKHLSTSASLRTSSGRWWEVGSEKFLNHPGNGSGADAGVLACLAGLPFLHNFGIFGPSLGAELFFSTSRGSN